MAQVPYSGAPEVGPQLDALPTPHVNAPAEAFGSSVSGAISHMGEVAQGAGKEIFGRAFAMQEMDEQFKADQAAADFTDKATDRYLEFDKLKGAERAAGFQKYRDDLNQMRMNGADAATSPYAKMKYLGDTRRTQNAMLWHGGVLARQGQDEASKAASEGQMNAAVNNYATVSPDDPKEFDAAVARVKSAAANRVHDQYGFEPGSEDNNNRAIELSSPKIRNMIESKLRVDPAAGKALAEQAKKGGLLTEQDSDILDDRVDSAVTVKAARKIGHQVGGDPKNIHEDPAKVMAAAKEAADKIDPDNAELKNNAVTLALTRQTQEQNIEKGAYRETLQTLTRGIDGSTTDGKVAVSIEEALQDPNFRTAWDSLPKDGPERGQVLEQIKRNQTTDGYIPNQTGNSEYLDLNQKLRAPNSPKEMDDALNANLLATRMTREQRASIDSLRDKVIKSQSGKGAILEDMRTPEVQAALDKAGLTDKTSIEYKQFVDQLGEAVKSYSEGGKKVIDRAALGEIAQGMLATQATKRFFGLMNGSTDPVYKDPSILQNVDAVRKRAIKSWKDTHFGDDPSEEQVKGMTTQLYSEYFRLLGEKSRPVPGKNTNRVGPTSADLPIGGPR